MKTGVTVTDAMTLKPVVTTENTSVFDCARTMLKKGVGSLVVVRNKKLVGLITEKDIVREVVAKNKSPKKLVAKDVMTKKLITVGPDTDIFDAMQIMEKEGVRRLPVVSPNKELLGLLTIKDILKVQPQLYDYIKEKAQVGKMKEKKQKYIEGECESCGAYGRLYEVDGQLLCEECRDEVSEIKEEQTEEEES